MRVFVAGGTGVIGRRLVPQLVARGHQVTATTTDWDMGRAFLGSVAGVGDRAQQCFLDAARVEPRVLDHDRDVRLEHRRVVGVAW